jgi:hypothetical protein
MSVTPLVMRGDDPGATDAKGIAAGMPEINAATTGDDTERFGELSWPRCDEGGEWGADGGCTRRAVPVGMRPCARRIIDFWKKTLHVSMASSRVSTLTDDMSSTPARQHTPTQQHTRGDVQNTHTTTDNATRTERPHRPA